MRLRERIFRLEGKDGRLTDQSQLLPLVVDPRTTDAEIERLRRNGRKVFRSGNPELLSEFI